MARVRGTGHAECRAGEPGHERRCGPGGGTMDGGEAGQHGPCDRPQREDERDIQRADDAFARAGAMEINETLDGIPQRQSELLIRPLFHADQHSHE